MTATSRMFEELARQGKTSAGLCHHLDIKSNVLANWKASDTIPPAKYLVSICEYLNVSVDWLLTGRMQEEPSQRESKWELDENQKRVANDYFTNLTFEQVALLNNYEKLNPEGKRATQKFITFTLKEQNESEQEPPAISKGLA